MSRNIWVFGGIVAFLMTQPSYADLFSTQDVIHQGNNGGVGHSWLHTGGTNGSNLDNMWKIDGDLLVEYSATGGNDNNGPLVELVSGQGNSNTLDVFDGNTLIGTMQITGFRLWDPGDHDNGVLGWIDIVLTSNGANADFDADVAIASSVRVDFLDRNYGNSNNGFNGFEQASGELDIRLWGDERQDGAVSDVNWGVDLASTGLTTTQVPAPGAIALAMIGMACVSRVRRRNA